MKDTSAAQARSGKDIQGIPWERLSISREKYRETRLEQYKNYENVPQSGQVSEEVCYHLPVLNILILTFFLNKQFVQVCTKSKGKIGI